MSEKKSRRERITGALKKLGVIRLKLPHSSLIEISILVMILSIAFIVRMLPIRWGFYLSEFDPYFHYNSANYLVNNGFAAWSTWTDYNRWYPFGNDVWRVSYPGLPFSYAALYVILRAVGFTASLWEVAIMWPVIMGTLTCLVIYFFTKDIEGKAAGLFAALFLALNAAYIQRTALGFSDDETVGIFGILLFFLFFLRAIETKRPVKNSVIYAVAAGLSLGYVTASWGASRYAVGVAAMFVFVLILLRRYSTRLLLSYSITFAIAFFIAINVPKLGFSFLTETFNLPIAGVLVLLCLCELFRHTKTMKTKVIITSTVLGLSLAMLFVLTTYGFLQGTPGKFILAMNPFGAVNPIAESVAEHKQGAWGTFYYDYGITALLIPVGLFFAIQNPTNRNIFISIFALTTIYFASSMIRLTLILSPALCVLAAVTLVRILKPFIVIMKEAPVIPQRKMRFGAHVGKEFSAALLIIMLIMLIFPFYLPRPRIISDRAYTPATIASSSAPIRTHVSDWIDALEWMHDNLPDTAVVVSWWDYGYWISIKANKTTLADNGTINTTQIAKIGRIFMSNETEAIKLLKTYDVNGRRPTHIVVFTTFLRDTQGGLSDRGWGDEGKWIWMAKIAYSIFSELGYEFDEYDRPTTFGNWTQQGFTWTDRGKNTVVYKLMTYGKETLGGATPSVTLQHFKPAYIKAGTVISTSDGQIFMPVLIYEIVY